MEVNLKEQVKLKNPGKGEETLVYNVVNYNESTQRVYIELICDWFLKPQELISINDIENL